MEVKKAGNKSVVSAIITGTGKTKNALPRTWKKPAGKPKRPLSAYNYFFHHHRSVVISSLLDKKELQEAESDRSSKPDLETMGGIKKRQRRSRGIGVGFADLARDVAQTWKALDAEGRKPYENQARADKDRYQKELDAWSMAFSKEQLPVSARQDREVINKEEFVLQLQNHHHEEHVGDSSPYDHGSNDMARQSQPECIPKDNCSTDARPHFSRAVSDDCCCNSKVHAPQARHKKHHVLADRHEVSALQPLAQWAIQRRHTDASRFTPPLRQEQRRPCLKNQPSKQSTIKLEKKFHGLKGFPTVTSATPDLEQQHLVASSHQDFSRSLPDSLDLHADLSAWANKFISSNQPETSFEPPSMGSSAVGVVYQSPLAHSEKDDFDANVVWGNHQGTFLSRLPPSWTF